QADSGAGPVIGKGQGGRGILPERGIAENRIALVGAMPLQDRSPAIAVAGRVHQLALWVKHLLEPGMPAAHPFPFRGCQGLWCMEITLLTLLGVLVAEWHATSRAGEFIDWKQLVIELFARHHD